MTSSVPAQGPDLDAVVLDAHFLRGVASWIAKEARPAVAERVEKTADEAEALAAEVRRLREETCPHVEAGELLLIGELRAALAAEQEKREAAEAERDELQQDRDSQTEWNNADDWLRDQHARYHGEDGNMLGKGDCGWPRCDFWDSAVWVLNAPPRAALSGDTTEEKPDLAAEIASYGTSGYLHVDKRHTTTQQQPSVTTNQGIRPGPIYRLSGDTGGGER